MKKLNNYIFAGFFALIGIAGVIGAIAGYRHQAFVALLSIVMVYILLNDNKKTKYGQKSN